MPSKIAFTNSTSNCLYAATERGEVVLDPKVDRQPAVLLEAVVHPPRLALDRAEVLGVLGDVLPRRVEQREHRRRARACSGCALEVAARRRGSRARCSSTDRCGRREATSCSGRRSTSSAQPPSTASLAASSSNSAGSTEIGCTVTSVAAAVVVDRAVHEVPLRAGDVARGAHGSSAAPAVACGSRRRRWRAAPSWIARRMSVGQHVPVVGLAATGCGRSARAAHRARAPARGGARGRGGSRGRRPTPRARARAPRARRRRRPSFTAHVAPVPRARATRCRATACARAPRGSAAGTRASGSRRRCRTSRRRSGRGRRAAAGTASRRVSAPRSAVPPPRPRRRSSSSLIALAIHVTSWCVDEAARAR